MTRTLVRRTLAALLLGGLTALAVLTALAWNDGSRVYMVRTGSMAPAHQPGDLVLTRPVATPAVGSVLTFRTSSGPVTHRVAELSADGLVMKGDANATADVMPVAVSDVVGQVETSVRGGGYVLHFLSQPAGAASVVTSLLAVGLAWQLFFPPGATSPLPRRPRRDAAAVGWVAVTVLAAVLTTALHGVPATGAYFSDAVVGSISLDLACADACTDPAASP